MNRNIKQGVIVIYLTVLSNCVFVSCGGGEFYSMDDPRDKALIEQMLKDDIEEGAISTGNNIHYGSDRRLALELQAKYKNEDNISGQSDGGSKASDFNSANYTDDRSFPFSSGGSEFATDYLFESFGNTARNNRPADIHEEDNAHPLNSDVGSGQRSTQNSGNMAGTGDGNDAADPVEFLQGYVQQMMQNGLTDNIPGGAQNVQELIRLANSGNLIGITAAFPRASQLLSAVFRRCPGGNCGTGNPADLGGLAAMLTQVLEGMSSPDGAGSGAAEGRNQPDLPGLAGLLQQVMGLGAYGLGTAGSRSLPDVAGLSATLLQLLGGNRGAASTAGLPQLLDLIQQIMRNAPPGAGPARGDLAGDHPPPSGPPGADSA